MLRIIRTVLVSALLLCSVAPLAAQEQSQGVMRRRGAADRNRQTQQDGSVVTERMQNFYSGDNSSISDADRQWMRVIYRAIDLDKDANAALYFPEEPIAGQENLFRIIMRLLASNTVPAYEYLDGREIFTERVSTVALHDVVGIHHIEHRLPHLPHGVTAFIVTVLQLELRIGIFGTP